MIPRHAKKILLVRLSARGDVVFASPLAAAIKRSRPDVHLTWVAEARTADVIQHNPHIDAVLVWERARWKALWKTWKFGQLFREARDFRRTLRRQGFDVAIDAQGLLRSGALAFLSGAPLRIGLGSREGSRFLMTRVLPRGGDDRAISSEYKHLAVQLGVDPADFEIEIPPGADNEAYAADLIAKKGLEDGYVVASPFTTRHFKHWFEDRWSELLGRIMERTGKPVVLLGGPDDREAAERILAGVKGVVDSSVINSSVVDLVGRTSLGQASAVVARSELLVGVDTGLSHMAHGYRRPAVLLFGSNTPYLDAPTPLAQILHSGRACSPCRGQLICDGRIDCMRDLTVDDVLAAVERGLADDRLPTVGRGD